MSNKIGTPDGSLLPNAVELQTEDSPTAVNPVNYTTGAGGGPLQQEVVQVEYAKGIATMVDILMSIDAKLGMLVEAQCGIDVG